MSEHNQNVDPLFLQLVLTFQAGAWQHLGKVASPISGKVERDLRMAQHTIDLLSMIEVKTKGNLNEEESSLLQHVLYELRLNYVDERKKEEAEKTAPAESAAADQPAAEPGSDQPSDSSEEKSGEG